MDTAPAAAPPIGRAEFEARLAFLLTGQRRNLPRRLRDRHIVLKAAAARVHGGRDYSERDINERLQDWLAEVGGTLRLDHVTLRRHLVDYGYLDRTPTGDRYRVLERAAVLFDTAVTRVDQRAVLAAAMRAVRRSRPSS